MSNITKFDNQINILRKLNKSLQATSIKKSGRDRYRLEGLENPNRASGLVDYESIMPTDIKQIINATAITARGYSQNSTPPDTGVIKDGDFVIVPDELLPLASVDEYVIRTIEGVSATYLTINSGEALINLDLTSDPNFWGLQ